MICKLCGETLKAAMMMALIQDFGGRCYPPADYCPATKDHKHEWEDKPLPDAKEET